MPEEARQGELADKLIAYRESLSAGCLPTDLINQLIMEYQRYLLARA